MSGDWRSVLDGRSRWAIAEMECLRLLRSMPDASVDSVVTDPPYNLSFMGKGWDSVGGARAFQAWCEEWARETLRVLKPGGWLLAFGGTRTSHRLVCGIEDAGFEIRDSIAWLYGSGFPKSLNVSKAIDAAAGVERGVVGVAVYGDGHVQRSAESIGFGGCDPAADSRAVTAAATAEAARWSGWGTALKPSHEPIVVARKPFVGTVAGNVQRHGTGALNIDGCRIPAQCRPARVADVGGASVNAYGDGLNGSRAVGSTDLGRWPANLALDEEAAALLDEQAGGKVSRFFYCAKTSRAEREAGCEHLPARTGAEAVDREEGVAGTRSPRAGAGRTAAKVRNHHATVKPIALMRWLVRLVTPPSGVVLDLFTGSGTTGCAAVLEGFRFIGAESDTTEGYAPIAAARIEHWLGVAEEAAANKAAETAGLTTRDVEAGQDSLFGGAS